MDYRPAIVVCIVSIALYGCASTHSDTDTEKKASSTSQPPTAKGTLRLSREQIESNSLEASDVIEGTVAPYIQVIARVRPRNGGETEVFSPFAGRLDGEFGLPRVGDAVSKGQRIADLEQQFVASEKLQIATAAIQIQSELQQAQQELDLKRTELSRAQQLYDQGAIALKQVQTAQLDVKQAETKVEAARRSKEQYDAAQSAVNSQPRRAAITAPISGVVLNVDAAMGQQVDASKRLLTIADLDTVWVEAAVHERDLPRVRGANEAEVVIPSSDEKPFIGRLVTVGNLVDSQNRTVPMIFAVKNREAALKLEMYVEARIPSGPAKHALLIPSSAVLSDRGQYSVYVQTQPGIYSSRTVQLGEHKGNLVAVTSGLQKGDKVVSVGAQSLLSESRKNEIPVDTDSDDKKEK
jgi:cobalt-zinc-cadmium efflux system membrane fusion protein